MNTFEQTLTKYNANFDWNEDNHTWCLYGTDNGNGWETDDYEAETREQAESDAIDYLEAYNEQA
jgi:hypothetical protein